MTLPTLGLGLSSNAQRDDVPRPYAMLDAHPGLFDFVEYSAPLDVALARTEATLFGEMEARRSTVPLVYHPVHLNLFGPALESAERLALCAAHVQAVGSPWVSNDVGWWHHEGIALPGYLYLPPPLTTEGLAAAVTHVAHVRDAMPVPLLIENPAVMTRRGSMHVLEFMARLSEATGCPLLIDVGHLVSHQLAYGLPLDAGCEGVPWERVAQLHIAGGVVTHDGIYADDHPQPIRDETWSVFEALLERCTKLKAVTYEGDGHPEPLARRNLERIRRALPALSADQPSGSRVKVDTSTLDQESMWALFEDVHSTRGPELTFRAAVLAQQLDAEVPLARAAVAPTVEQLLPFITDGAFTRWFREGARTLGDSFLSWAMTQCRRPELEGADALISLEVWARQTWARGRKGDVAHVDATFPVDLTEALHASTALRRHLEGRGIVSGDGWDGLLQCARRAPRVPWNVRLQPVGQRIRVSPRD